MMLDKNCKKVLKQLNKFYKNSNFFVEASAISQMCKLDKYETNTILNFLVSCGYIEKNNYSKVMDVYHPTIIGKNYFSNQYKIFLKFIVGSFICPIVVSLITTLLTLWLS